MQTAAIVLFGAIFVSIALALTIATALSATRPGRWRLARTLVLAVGAVLILGPLGFLLVSLASGVLIRDDSDTALLLGLVVLVGFLMLSGVAVVALRRAYRALPALARRKVDLGPAGRWYWVGAVLIVLSVGIGNLAPGTLVGWVALAIGLVGMTIEGLALRALMRRAQKPSQSAALDTNGAPAIDQRGAQGTATEESK
ncbi:MAG TPA: hypothetical protein VF808_13870 [Ktedonobacterales bacterium]